MAGMLDVVIEVMWIWLYLVSVLGVLTIALIALGIATRRWPADKTMRASDFGLSDGPAERSGRSSGIADLL